LAVLAAISVLIELANLSAVTASSTIFPVVTLKSAGVFSVASKPRWTTSMEARLAGALPAPKSSVDVPAAVYEPTGLRSPLMKTMIEASDGTLWSSENEVRDPLPVNVLTG